MSVLSAKFSDPLVTAKGEERAFVDLKELTTLWFNTGSLCNLACQNCYIESSPQNDRLAFISTSDIMPYLEEIKRNGLPTTLIGLTGGEPFANPHIISVLETILAQGFDVLVLTNAYKVIKKYKEELEKLKFRFQNKLQLRVSLDHYTEEVHEQERGENTFEETLKNIKWLVDDGFHISLAGRSLIKEPHNFAINGYQKLMDEYLIPLKLVENESIVIFPEMDKQKNVPEISISCWSILNKSPNDQMCSSQRMIIKKKGENQTTVMPCTLLAYDKQFELGPTLVDAKKRVFLNHPFCAEFCVLGGASCTLK